MIQQLVDMKAKEIMDMLIEVIVLFINIITMVTADVSDNTPIICYG